MIEENVIALTAGICRNSRESTGSQTESIKKLKENYLWIIQKN